ncbi:uncharacterized protein LOC143231604 isoform X1 [Tachypleus tridentatus]|uniref:uncharacterized protein LOC143231604 isoform X1 n=1 Tax=Tachypleus tridentatus TaxID=6853 RepID=UPI003FD00B45
MGLSASSFADTFSISENCLIVLTHSLNEVFSQDITVALSELRYQKQDALAVVENICRNIGSHVHIYPVGSSRTNLYVRDSYDFDFQLRHTYPMVLHTIKINNFDVIINSNSIEFRKSVFDVCESSIEIMRNSHQFRNKSVEAKEGIKAMQIQIINNHTNDKVKIDVVPVIDVSKSQVVLNKLKSMQTVIEQLKLCDSNLDDLSSRSVPIAHILPKENKNGWELDLTPLCKHILKRLGQKKKVIRILKALRNNMQWCKSGLYSSHIFTVLVLSLDVDRDISLGKIFIEALLKLYKAVEKGYLQDIFDSYKKPL